MATYQTIIDDSRVLLQDTVDNRFSDADLVAVLNRGLLELARLRPDAFYTLYDANSLNVPRITAGTPGSGETALSAEVDVEDQFIPALVNYVVAVTEITNDEFTVDGRAMTLLQQFRSTLLGV
jgi:hypothetical protein